MEIERKFLVADIPLELDRYQVKHMEQLYVSTRPVIRIRRSDDKRVLTVKSKGLLSRQDLRLKAEGNVIEKDRYIIPVTDTEGTRGDWSVDEKLCIELDVFHGIFQGLVYAEVEFPSEEAAEAFTAPKWFLRDVTGEGMYQNSALSSMDESDIERFIEDAYRL